MGIESAPCVDPFHIIPSVRIRIRRHAPARQLPRYPMRSHSVAPCIDRTLVFRLRGRLARSLRDTRKAHCITRDNIGNPAVPRAHSTETDTSKARWSLNVRDRPCRHEDFKVREARLPIGLHVIGRFAGERSSNCVEPVEVLECTRQPESAELALTAASFPPMTCSSAG